MRLRKFFWGLLTLCLLLSQAPASARLNDDFLARVPRMQTKDGAFAFAYIGDVQIQFSIFRRALLDMSADPSIRFLIVGGDMMDKSRDRGYRDFLKRIEGVPFPVVALPGNHDVWGDQKAALFQKYIGDEVTSFTVGNTRFILLRNTSGNLPEKVKSRFASLLRECKADRKIRRLFVCMHVPPFDPRTNSPGHSMNAASAREFFAMLEPLASERSVTVMASHVHGCFFRQHGDIQVVVSGGGGGALYGKGEEFFHHYMKVELQGGRVLFKPVRVEKPSETSPKK